MELTSLKSPNFNQKSRNIKDIKFIVIHYTGMQSLRASLKRLCNPIYKVSSHYLIDRDGKIFQIVKDNKIAWHAGKSKWNKIKNLNKNSIGIELVNKGHNYGYEKFTSAQIKKLVQLCIALKKKYKIDKSCILGHSDIAPLRKKDPGEKFPWFFLSKKGLGVWYKKVNKNSYLKKKKNLRNVFFKNLHKIGYRYFNKIKSSKSDKIIIKAFQRRYLQDQVNGVISKKTFIISDFLANKR